MSFDLFHDKCVAIGARSGISEDKIRFSDEGHYFVAVFPCGSKLVGNSITNSVRLIDAAKGRCVARL